MENKQEPSGILFFIFNHDINDNSMLWLNRLRKHGMNAYILDSGSDYPPEGPYVKQYPNIFWCGMFKEAVKYTLKNNFKWMFLVCDDILIGDADFSRLLMSLSNIYNRNDIGIYQPAVVGDSHSVIKENYFKKTYRLRSTPVVEGYCMAIRREVLEECKFLLDYDFETGYGWDTDGILCRKSMELGYKNVVDDSVRIYHPMDLPRYEPVVARVEKRRLVKEIYNETYEEFKKNIRKKFDEMNYDDKYCTTLLVCICKNENDHLHEYVEYYKNLGVTNVCIIDNNDPDGEKIEDAIGDYIDSGYVFVTNFRGQKSPQCRAYSDVYKKYYDEYNWFLFFDADEYLTLVEDKKLSDYLCRPCFGDYNMIHVNWMVYGDNGYVHKQKGSLLEVFKEAAPYSQKIGYEFPENNHIKSVIRGGFKDLTMFTRTPHTPLYKDFKCCDAAGRECNPISPFCNYDFSLAYLKHFTTKSTEEYISKLKKGFADMERTNYEFLIVSRYFGVNEVTEEKIKMFNEAFNLDLNYMLKRYNGERSEVAKVYLLCYAKKDFDFIDDKVVRPLQVGAANGTEVCKIKDNTGTNISSLNYFYTENTGTFWIWQNVHGCKYKGQMQYRRPLSGVNETMNFDEVFRKYDVITCTPFNHPANSKPTDEQPMFIPANTVEGGYAFSNCGDDLYILESFIKLTMPEYAEDYDKYIKNGENLYYSNGFVMTTENYDKYCEFLFKCLNGYIAMAGITDYNSLVKHVQDNLKAGKYIRYANNNNVPPEAIIWQTKIGGFLSERIWTLWLLHNFPKERILELPYIKQEANKMYT